LHGVAALLTSGLYRFGLRAAWAWLVWRPALSRGGGFSAGLALACLTTTNNRFGGRSGVGFRSDYGRCGIGLFGRDPAILAAAWPLPAFRRRGNRRTKAAPVFFGPV